jgi:hypothetical protein
MYAKTYEGQEWKWFDFGNGLISCFFSFSLCYTKTILQLVLVELSLKFLDHRNVHCNHLIRNKGQVSWQIVLVLREFCCDYPFW